MSDVISASASFMKIHLVDGTYELFRAFFGAPGASVAGREVGATRQLMRSIAALLGEPDVTHVAVAFDTVIESFRNDLYPGYKTGAGIDEALHAQFPLAEEAVAAMGVVVWGMVQFEADDALAAGAVKYGAEDSVDQIVLCSPDKDLCQCVRDGRVIVRDRMRKKELDAAGVEAKFGVAPASIPDFLALTGDSADGFPGIPRWGAKSAAAVLAHYHHLEEIPDDADRWAVKVRGAASLARELASRRDEALLFKQLATLRTDVPLAESLDDLRWQGPRPSLDAFCERIAFRPVLPRVQ